jgi:hypothetical protein
VPRSRSSALGPGLEATNGRLGHAAERELDDSVPLAGLAADPVPGIAHASAANAASHSQNLRIALLSIAPGGGTFGERKRLRGSR